MRVVFFGNHTLGVRALQAILESDQVVGVVAHPADPEDGVRYESVYQFARQQKLNVVRSTGGDETLPGWVAECRPDLLWVTDYRYLLSPEILDLSPGGAINLHPSLLPLYRGRAALNWAILNGEREVGLTAHVIDEGLDSGDIVAQVRVPLGPEQDIGDALRMLYPVYAQITREVLAWFRSGCVPRRRQDHRLATIYPRRRPEDGRINWSLPAERIVNLVRAVARPYPGAFADISERRLTIWRAAELRNGSSNAAPGTIVTDDPTRIVVQTGSGLLESRDFEWSVRPGAEMAGLPIDRTGEACHEQRAG